MSNNDDMSFYNEYSVKVIFIANQKHILTVDLEKINNLIILLDKDNLDTILFISNSWLGVANLKSAKHLKNI